MYTVTDQLSFPTLLQLITHFEKQEIPGDGTLGLYLQNPISKQSSNKQAPIDLLSPKKAANRPSPRASPKSTPPASPRQQRKALDNTLFNAAPVKDLRQQNADISDVPDPGNRPPMPIPRDPIYDSTQHKYGIYAIPDDPDRDRFYDIRDLCKRADDEIAKQAKKCTCGLYLSESTLVDNWMMHRDIENTATKGKIFFVNTVTNEATWQLPESVKRKMEETQADKWKKIKALLQREMAKQEAGASDV